MIMNRNQMMHLIKSATSLVQSEFVYIFNSESILFNNPKLHERMFGPSNPTLALAMWPRDEKMSQKALMVNSAIGRDTKFQEVFGYCVAFENDETKAAYKMLPKGWQNRAGQNKFDDITVFMPSNEDAMAVIMHYESGYSNFTKIKELIENCSFFDFKKFKKSINGLDVNDERKSFYIDIVNKMMAADFGNDIVEGNRPDI